MARAIWLPCGMRCPLSAVGPTRAVLLLYMSNGDLSIISVYLALFHLAGYGLQDGIPCCKLPFSPGAKGFLAQLDAGQVPPRCVPEETVPFLGPALGDTGYYYGCLLLRAFPQVALARAFWRGFSTFICYFIFNLLLLGLPREGFPRGRGLRAQKHKLKKHKNMVHLARTWGTRFFIVAGPLWLQFLGSVGKSVCSVERLLACPYYL